MTMPVTMAVGMTMSVSVAVAGGSRSRDQRCGSDRNGGTKGECEFADHGLLLCLRWVAQGCGHRILDMGRAVPEKGSKRGKRRSLHFSRTTTSSPKCP